MSSNDEKKQVDLEKLKCYNNKVFKKVGANYIKIQIATLNNKKIVERFTRDTFSLITPPYYSRIFSYNRLERRYKAEGYSSINLLSNWSKCNKIRIKEGNIDGR